MCKIWYFYPACHDFFAKPPDPPLVPIAPLSCPVIWVVAMVTDGSSQSYSHINHLSFQSHHFHVPVHSIYPPCSRSSYCSFPGWLNVHYLPICMFQRSSSNMPKSLQSSVCHFDCIDTYEYLVKHIL